MQSFNYLYQLQSIYMWLPFEETAGCAVEQAPADRQWLPTSSEQDKSHAQLAGMQKSWLRGSRVRISAFNSHCGSYARGRKTTVWKSCFCLLLLPTCWAKRQVFCRGILALGKGNWFSSVSPEGCHVLPWFQKILISGKVSPPLSFAKLSCVFLDFFSFYEF